MSRYSYSLDSRKIVFEISCFKEKKASLTLFFHLFESSIMKLATQPSYSSFYSELK
ncbi:hypothetical protein SPAR160_0024 [Streptococcus pneumoniae GA58581]|nr:hypothetical protein SPAR74_0026 [Streptococcus pneumoniae GA41688]EHE46670.1 hypothetical protein SPAR109_0028 [Streptococcus pneumoniae GA47976]EJH08351.1 hypothetical protein SPAR160_0024 [Streptococcus pneumoniae GA58581]